MLSEDEVGMYEGVESGRKRAIRFRKEETTDKNGHWTREFSVRTEPWPVVEHWAAEHGFRMVAYKGRRRVYHRGSNTGRAVTLIEIKQTDGGLKLSAWIQVGFFARLLRFFTLPAVLTIEPTGWKGARMRRRACREFNSLLFRFRQPAIAGSDTLHIADIDLSTLLLLVGSMIPLISFVYGAATHLELKTALLVALLPSISRPLAYLALTAAGLSLVHHFVFVKRFGLPLIKGLSASIAFTSLILVSAFLYTRTSTQLNTDRVSFYCLQRSDSSACRNGLFSLSDDQVYVVAKRVENLRKELAAQTAPIKNKAQ